MNTQAVYSQQRHRLILGISVLDALRSFYPNRPLRAEIEYFRPHQSPYISQANNFGQRAQQPPVAFTQHASGRLSLLYYAGIQNQLTIRLYDTALEYIPRRIQVPLISLAEIESIETLEPLDYFGSRVRRIVVFASSQYPLSGGETGLRGRVLRDGVAMRWAFIEARSPASNEIVTRSRTDHRGEFLLVLPPSASLASDISPTLDLRLSVIGPPTVPAPISALEPTIDPWWDLPLEILPNTGTPDTVASGEQSPAGFVTALSTVRDVSFQIGRLLTGRDINDFEFVFP